ncbi:MAG: hypothetical protein L6R36_006294 [Xanthoria steineri]|nr:MAG: hypothetical protein L6R36_006294 [Xanthoria steineri]
MSSPNTNNTESFWQTYDRATDFLSPRLTPHTLVFVQNAIFDRRRFLIDQASDLKEQSSDAVTEEERVDFARRSERLLRRAREIVPWCLAVELMSVRQETRNGGDEEDETWLVGLKVSQALRVYDEEEVEVSGGGD